MKVTLNWLRDYVDFDGSPAELAERLTQLGLEVEAIEPLGDDFPGVVVAEVLTRDHHPNADKLSVCRVHDGQGERQIVCGAHNFKPGDKVPLILPGHALPPRAGESAPFVIKVGKIRGVESHGMMCAAEELGIDPESIGLTREDGLLILKPEAAVGQPFAEYLGRGRPDTLFDLEVTPNRPDLNSVLGIAREIAAVTGQPLRLPTVPAPDPAPDRPSAARCVAVHLEAPDLCPRYTARVLFGVRIGPSPDWLRTALERVGLRSINNVVDVTNYVMLETGQPLHAFDYRRLAPDARGLPTVIVRRARDGESFTALDGRTHTLGSEHLVIADPAGTLALAGVIGGRHSEVTNATRDILIESANFAPTSIRRTSKALGIRTDASYRFERGADPSQPEAASARAAHLILALAGGSMAEGVVDAYPAPVPPRLVTLRHARVNQLLGTRLQPEEIECLLAQLGLKAAHRRPRAVAEPAAPEPLTVSIPTYRVDLKREADLIEEVARMYGVDRIPAAPPRQAQGTHPFDARYDTFMEVRRLLTALGFSEAQGQTLVALPSIRAIPDHAIVRLANPLSHDMDALRPSLIPGLLDVLRHNLRHQNRDVALFELGRIVRREPASSRTAESWSVALALTGARHPAFWAGSDRDVRCDIHDLKGALEEFLEHLGLRGTVCRREDSPTDLFVEQAAITLGGKLPLGTFGQLHPRLARDHDLRDAVFLAELNLDALLARRNPARPFKTLPDFPATRRDAAMLLPESVTHDAVLQAVRQAKAPHLESAELFDVFRDDRLPAGQKSVAYAFTYRAPDRTLTDAEANASHERILAQLKDRLGAIFRA